MSNARWSPLAVCTLAVAADATVLVTLRPLPAELAHRLAHPRRWADTAGLDTVAGTLAGAALWLLAAWVAVGLVTALAGRLPGITGTAARRISAVALPRALYRAAAGAAGLGVLLSPAVATAGASLAVPPPLPPSESSPAAAELPAPQLPVARVQTPRTVTVRPGDSLWAIAAARLGANPAPARVAAAWPRWFATNRAVIGADPDHLVPGEVLKAPEGPR